MMPDFHFGLQAFEITRTAMGSAGFEPATSAV